MSGVTPLRAAGSATAVRRRLLRRRHELRGVRNLARSNRARRTAGRSIGECEAGLQQIDQRLGELTASIAALAGDADEAAVRHHLDEVAAATERATALAAALEEVEEIDRFTGQ